MAWILDDAAANMRPDTMTHQGGHDSPHFAFYYEGQQDRGTARPWVYSARSCNVLCTYSDIGPSRTFSKKIIRGIIFEAGQEQ